MKRRSKPTNYDRQSEKRQLAASSSRHFSWHLCLNAVDTRETPTAQATARHFLASSRASAPAATRLHCTPSFSPAHPAPLHTTPRALAGPRRSTSITAQTRQAARACQRGRKVQNENGTGLRFDDAPGRVIDGRRRGLYLYDATLFDPDPGLGPRGHSPPLAPDSPLQFLAPIATPSRRTRDLAQHVEI